MEYPSITWLVDSCTSMFKPAMIFNISPCVSVASLMPQQNIIYFFSNIACNITCTIHINLLCIQERIFFKHMKARINISSEHGMQKSTKIRNTPTSSINIVMHIIIDICLTDAHLRQQFITSMIPSFVGVPEKI